MLKPLLPIPQNAVAFGNRVLATGPPGKSLSPSLLSLLGPVFISAGTSASFPIFLSVTLPSLRLFSSLSPHSIPIFLLHPPPLLRPSVTGGLCSVPHFPPPSARTAPFILRSPQSARRLLSALQEPLPVSATRCQQSIVLRSPLPHSSDWKQVLSVTACRAATGCYRSGDLL